MSLSDLVFAFGRGMKMRNALWRCMAVAIAVLVCLVATPLFAADDADGGAHESGPPLGFERDLALWSGVTFIVFVLVLRKFAWGPLVTGLDKRESGIRTAIAEANAAREKAERMLKEHEESLQDTDKKVQEILAEARRDAVKAKDDIIATATAEAEALKDRSITEIERAKEVALRELFDNVSNQVVQATEHVLGRAMNDDDRGRFVNEALSQFAESSQS